MLILDVLMDWKIKQKWKQHLSNRKVKHGLHLLSFSIFIFVTYLYMNDIREDSIENKVDPFDDYGLIGSAILYFLRLLVFLSLPSTLINMAGLVFFNIFPNKEKNIIQLSSLSQSFMICFRVVTRGDYPELVRVNLERNIQTCINAGLDRFMFEVVTDKELNLPKNPRVREVVVDPAYRSRSGCRYKARALQYALEDNVNILESSDWITHLDEETLLTQDVVNGILHFAIKNKHEIGQGMITYANEMVVNWLATLADSFRVGADLGQIRFSLKALHKPTFSFKGSFVVTKMSCERSVSFDNGMAGSIAEDVYFALKASSMGYTFDWIEGEMWEKSPFNIMDFVQQRKRWIQGIYLVVHDPNLPIKCKIWLAFSLYSWITAPFSILNTILFSRYPLPTSALYNFFTCLIFTVNMYLYLLGSFKQFKIKRIGQVKFIVCLILCPVAITFAIITENIAIIWGMLGDKTKFYVVQKVYPGLSSGNASV